MEKEAIEKQKLGLARTSKDNDINLRSGGFEAGETPHLIPLDLTSCNQYVINETTKQDRNRVQIFTCPQIKTTSFNREFKSNKQQVYSIIRKQKGEIRYK